MKPRNFFHYNPRSAAFMSSYQKAAALSFGGTAMIFYVVPLSILSFVSKSEAVEMIALAVSFIIPLIVTTVAFANWAGRYLIKSKIPSFLMGFSSLVISSCFSVFAMMILLPADKSHDLTAHEINAALVSVFFMLFFGAPASIIASIFFIGSCQKQTERN